LRVDFKGEAIVTQLRGCELVDADTHVQISYGEDKSFGAAVMETILQLQMIPPKILRFTDDDVYAMQPPDVQNKYPRVAIDEPVEQQTPKKTTPFGQSLLFKDQMRMVSERGRHGNAVLAVDEDVTPLSDDVIFVPTAAPVDSDHTTTTTKKPIEPSGFYNDEDRVKSFLP
jgi:hypothetical protein